jgi:hypothetical protein
VGREAETGSTAETEASSVARLLDGDTACAPANDAAAISRRRKERDWLVFIDKQF